MSYLGAAMDSPSQVELEEIYVPEIFEHGHWAFFHVKLYLCAFVLDLLKERPHRGVSWKGNSNI